MHAGCHKIAGLLDYNEDYTIDENQTYVLEDYEIKCSGIVNAWEFCYQAKDQLSVTFYPGIWNKMGERFTLIQSNTVTFTPNGDIFSCQMFNLSVKEQFSVEEDSFVGLYSNVGSERPLLLTAETKKVKIHRVSGNHTSIPEDDDDGDYNIAIKVHIGEYV